MALFYDTVPDPWVARAYPSMMGLAAWYADLLLRIRVRTVSPGVTADAPPQPPGRQDHGGEEGACVPARSLEAPTSLAFVRAGPEGLAHATQTPGNAGASCRREERAAEAGAVSITDRPSQTEPEAPGRPSGERLGHSLLWAPESLCPSVRPSRGPPLPIPSFMERVGTRLC